MVQNLPGTFAFSNFYVFHSTLIYRLLQSITARASPGAFGWMATHFKTANLVLNYFRFTATLSLSSVPLRNCIFFLTLYSNFMNLLLPSQKQHFLAMWKQNMTIKQIFMILLKLGASAYGWSHKMKCCIFLLNQMVEVENRFDPDTFIAFRHLIRQVSELLWC